MLSRTTELWTDGPDEHQVQNAGLAQARCRRTTSQIIGIDPHQMPVLFAR